MLHFPLTNSHVRESTANVGLSSKVWVKCYFNMTIRTVWGVTLAQHFFVRYSGLILK